MKMSRRDAASEQIDQAIGSLFAGFIAPAITLAGAAESSLSESESSDRVLFHLMKAAAVRRGLSEKEGVRRINGARDWLKHPQPDLPKLDLLEWDTVVMILRAYTKFISEFGEGSATPAMGKFEDWFREEYEHVLQPWS